jgi:uncharacterized protein (DUF2141 family)
MKMMNRFRCGGLRWAPIRGRRSLAAVWVLSLTYALVAIVAIGTAAADSNAETAAPSDVANAAVGTLHVQITDLESDKGFLFVALLDSADQYDAGDRFFRSDNKVPIREGKASVTFERVPYGTYAVKVFHDENANGELDTNFVGFPKEGFGFSNDAMGQFGPPTFEQAAFSMQDEVLRIEITAN